MLVLQGVNPLLVFASVALHVLVFMLLPPPGAAGHAQPVDILLTLRQAPVPDVEPEPEPPSFKKCPVATRPAQPAVLEPATADLPVPELAPEHAIAQEAQDVSPPVAGSLHAVDEGVVKNTSADHPAPPALKLENPLFAIQQPTLANTPGVEPEHEDISEPLVDVNALLMDYAASVKMAILEEKYYPKAAERLGHEGTVNVGFTVAADGSLTEARIKASSGYSDLDEAALTAVNRASPFASLPPETARDSLALNIALRYVIK